MAFTKLLKLYQGLQEKYNSLQVKNPYAFYVTTDTKLLYKGEDLLSSVIWTDSVPAADVALEDIIYVVLNTQAGTAALYTLIGGEMVQISGADEKMDKINPEGSGHFRFNGAADDYSYTLGDCSLAMGLNTKVSGENSVAFGQDNSIDGDSTFVEGESNTISGHILASHIEGMGTNAENSEILESHIEGASHTIGEASLYATHIEGSQNTINDSADISSSVVQGFKNTVDGRMYNGSVLEGYENEVPSNFTLYASKIGGYNNITEAQLEESETVLEGTELKGALNHIVLDGQSFGSNYEGHANTIVLSDFSYGNRIEGSENYVVAQDPARGNIITGDQTTFISGAAAAEGCAIFGDHQTISAGGDEINGILCYGENNSFSGLGATTGAYGSLLGGSENTSQGLMGIRGGSISGYLNTVSGITSYTGSNVSGKSNVVTGFGEMTGCEIGGSSNQAHGGANGTWQSTALIGEGCIAQGIDYKGSHITGYQNTIQGSLSGYAKGADISGSQNTITLAGADVDGHHIEGTQNVVTLTSNQSGVHIEGYSNTITAAGTGSHVQGRDHIVALTSTKPVTVLGQGAAASGNKEYSVVIGNGDSQTKNNAVTIDYNGNIEIEGLLCQNLNNQDISIAAGASYAYALDAIPEGRFFDFDIRESIITQGVTDYDVAYSGKLLKQKTNVKTVVTHYQLADITLSTTANSVTITNNSASDRVFTIFTNIT